MTSKKENYAESGESVSSTVFRTKHILHRASILGLCLSLLVFNLTPKQKDLGRISLWYLVRTKKLCPCSNKVSKYQTYFASICNAHYLLGCFTRWEVLQHSIALTPSNFMTRVVFATVSASVHHSTEKAYIFVQVRISAFAQRSHR